MSVLTSRDNPKVKRWAKLVRDARARREERRLLVEGPHLVAAALAAGLKPVALIVEEQALARAEVGKLLKGRDPVVVSRPVFGAISDVETPQGIAAEIELPSAPLPASGDMVFLEGIQDAGNAGTLLRTAAAFGIRAVVLDAACADPWSPKVLRAAAGAHFALAVRHGALDEAMRGFKGRLVAAVAHGGEPLARARLSGRLGWIFGSEGQGVSRALLDRAEVRVTVPTTAGVESLNVAAAAAVCLYAGFSRPGAGS